MARVHQYSLISSLYRLNEGMFAGSGGYILKPEGYRCEKPTITTTTTDPQGAQTAQQVAPEEQKQQHHIQHRTLDLEVKVLAAQNLPLPLDASSSKSFHPYLKVELHVEEAGQRHGHFPEDGHACDPATQARHHSASSSTHSLHRKRSDEYDDKEGEYKARTKTAKSPTTDPDFKGELLEFKGIPGVVEELSFVRFIVRDDELFQRDDLAAWACVRLDRLRLGYRFVRMMDAKGKATDGVLLVKVMKKVY